MSIESTYHKNGQTGSRYRPFWLVVAILLLISGSYLAITLLLPDQGYSGGEEISIWPTDEWLITSPEEQNMDSATLEEMMALIDKQGFYYDSVLVVRHGKIVFEEYRNGYTQDRKHHLQSVTKSFSSMLIGIAIEEGFIENVNQKVVDFFPNHTIANLDAPKQRLTLENLLTMSDGMDWHELDYPYTDSRNTLGQMWTSRDAVQYVLDQPVTGEPGETWAYNSGTSILLGGIIEQTTGLDVLSFARKYLFDPIGIKNVEWTKTTGNHFHTDGGLYMTPRDMARFGYLMLRNGEWDGRQIVSPEWIKQSTEAHFQTGVGKGYGYQWWTMEGSIFAATGHYEQLIYVIPTADMVVLFTGNIPDNVLKPTDGFLYQYILRACTDLPPEFMYQKYTGYDINFEYPVGFVMTELPFPGQDLLSNESGIVHFRLNSYPFELINILWFQTQEAMEPESIMADFTSFVEQQQGTKFWPDYLEVMMKGEHLAAYQFFDLEQQGLQLRGTAVAWYCPESKRAFIYSYLTNPEISDQDLALNFQEHLDSLICHSSRPDLE